MQAHFYSHTRMSLHTPQLSECDAMNDGKPAIPPAAKAAAGNLLSDVELAALLGASLQTVRNWRWRGEGPKYVKLGGRMVR